MKATLSAAERAARGKDARAGAPRSSHADWEPAGDRADPIEVLQRQAAARIPELVPIRYERMLVSPFAFFRGGAAVMAADLASTPQSGLRTQLCGDAHLLNFGAFAAPDRRMVFDLNDFDETLPGPWEWDVKRLAASLAVAGRDLGFNRKERRAVVLESVSEYRGTMRGLAGSRNLEVWYARLELERLVDELRKIKGRSGRKKLSAVETRIAKAHGKNSLRALDRLCHRVDGEVRIVSDPPLIVPIEELFDDPARISEIEARVISALRAYMRTLPGDRRRLLESYRYIHLAHKVVGVGSVGTVDWIVLLLGRDEDDPLFLQYKEANASVLEEFVGASRHRNHGARVVHGQWLMQAASDMFLGWIRALGFDEVERDFYVRQLWDAKWSANLANYPPPALSIYGRMCGWTLARAHARAGDRIAIAGYLGSGDVFDRAIADFAELYADQNERDYGALVEAVKSGRVPAEAPGSPLRR
jgi:uncharacterized protein (DUF2252 family)